MANARQYPVRFTEKQLETLALILQNQAEISAGKLREDSWRLFDKVEDQREVIRREQRFGSK